MGLARTLKGFVPAIDRRDTSPLGRDIQQSLDASWKEGMVSQVTLSILDTFLIPYALFLGATTQQIGLLAAIPNLLSAFSQFFVAPAVRVAGNRRSLLVSGTVIQIFSLAPIAALPFLNFGWKIPFLIFLVSAFHLLGSLIGPSWGSLVSEYLPENRRGKYFGMRSRVVGVAGLLGVAFWGWVLSFLKHASNQSLGFVVLFGASVVFRLVTAFLIARMVDLPLHDTPDAQFTFWMFIRRVRESNFVRFILYVSTVTFAVQLSLPFLSVYMLQVLHFDYLAYTAVSLASTAIGFVAFPIWGRHGDVVGNARILKNTSRLIPIVPILWILARQPYQLVLAEMVSGFVFAGFNLCVANFIYESVSPEKRVRCLGYYNLINGTAAFLGNSLGGFLATHLPALLGSPIISLFVLSAIVRLGTDLFLAGQFNEVRKETPSVSSLQLFMSVVGLRPLLGANDELVSPLVPKEPDEYRRRAAAPRRRQERPASTSSSS